jgi:hypothetical protein
MAAFAFGSPKGTTDPVERIGLPDHAFLLKKASCGPMSFKETKIKEVHMSLTIGFSNPGAVTIGGKTAATINALSEAGADASSEALGTEKAHSNQVRTGGGAAPEETKAEGSDNQSVTVKTLLKRMQELQKQLQEQQQRLAAAQAQSYPTPEAKSQAVMSIQGQIAQTSGELMQVAAALVKEMTKGSTSGNLVSTTA